MRKEYIFAAVSIFMWSTIAVVTKLLLSTLNSMQILLASTLFASVFLFFACLFNGTLKQLRSYRIKDYFQIFVLGGLGIFLYHLLLYIGIDKMDASQAFIINYLWPIMTVVFACVILKEKMSARKAVAIVLSFVGVIIVTADGGLLNMGKDTLTGALYCVAAAVSYGLFSVLNKKCTYNKQLSMMLYCVSAFVLSLVCVLVSGDVFTMTLAQTAGFVWNGVFTIGIAYTTWALALSGGDTAKISNLAYITPFLSLVWTTLILREEPKLSSVAGLAVIVAGIFIQLKDQKGKGNK